MIKKLLLFSCLLFNLSFAQEGIPLMIDPAIIDVEIENSSELINSSGMKKSPTIEKIKRETDKTQPPKIKLDLNQIHHQRTLDYMNNRSGSMMPIF